MLTRRRKLEDELSGQLGGSIKLFLNIYLENCKYDNIEDHFSIFTLAKKWKQYSKLDKIQTLMCLIINHVWKIKTVLSRNNKIKYWKLSIGM